MAQQILSTNTFTTAKWIVSATASDGTHTTIAAALTSASSGDTIFIRPGTYTENITLKAGVNLTAFGSDSSINATGDVVISGTCTMTTAGTVTISGIQLQTNSAALLAVTGSAASIVTLNNCYINCTNNTGITHSSSNAASLITLKYCSGDIGTTGISLFTSTSTGILQLLYSTITNGGSSTTTSTVSAGTILLSYSVIGFPLTTSSSGVINAIYMSQSTSATNTTAITVAGTGSISIKQSEISSGTASAITIGTGTGATVFGTRIDSTNTNAITGIGTISYGNLTFSNTSQTINTTTQTIAGTIKGSTTTAPTAGYLGERITANAAAVATTNSTAKSLTNISLTAGVWDVSGISLSTATGGTALMQAAQLGISATNNTLPSGTAGIDYFQVTAVATALGCTTGPVRVVISATTIYYLVVDNFYSSTTCPTSGMITATRVG